MTHYGGIEEPLDELLTLALAASSKMKLPAALRIIEVMKIWSDERCKDNGNPLQTIKAKGFIKPDGSLDLKKAGSYTPKFAGN